MFAFSVAVAGRAAQAGVLINWIVTQLIGEKPISCHLNNGRPSQGFSPTSCEVQDHTLVSCCWLEQRRQVRLVVGASCHDVLLHAGTRAPASIPQHCLVQGQNLGRACAHAKVNGLAVPTVPGFADLRTPTLMSPQ